MNNSNSNLNEQGQYDSNNSIKSKSHMNHCDCTCQQINNNNIIYTSKKSNMSKMNSAYFTQIVSKENSINNGNTYLQVHSYYPQDHPSNNQKNIRLISNNNNLMVNSDNNNMKKARSYDSSLHKIKNQSVQHQEFCKNCFYKKNSFISSSKYNLARSSGVFLKLASKFTKFKKEKKAAKTLAIVVGCLSI